MGVDHRPVGFVACACDSVRASSLPTNQVPEQHEERWYSNSEYLIDPRFRISRSENGHERLEWRTLVESEGLLNAEYPRGNIPIGDWHGDSTAVESF